MPCADFIVERGEPAFRERKRLPWPTFPSAAAWYFPRAAAWSRDDENYPLLHQNSQIVMLNRPIAELPTRTPHHRPRRHR